MVLSRQTDIFFEWSVATSFSFTFLNGTWQGEYGVVVGGGTGGVGPMLGGCDYECGVGVRGRGPRGRGF